MLKSPLRRPLRARYISTAAPRQSAERPIAADFPGHPLPHRSVGTL